MTFQPGQSGNPGGLRKYKEFATALRMELAALGDGDQRGMRKVAASLINKALEGNIAAVKEIADRLDGKAIQQMQIEREDRIKFIAVVPEKSATTEEWLKLIGEERVLEHQPTDVESTE